MKKYNGCFMGIVVQNNDPEKRGRVKVWVPHVMTTINENWNSDFTQENGVKDKHFVFPDLETNPDLTNVIQKLKETLPWAETAMPLFGGSASGRFNAFKTKGSTSDSNYWEKDNMIEGSRPVQNYIGENRLSDVFTNTGAVGNRIVNPYSHQYVPSDYSNLARGSFNIPNVGAHVWVFFIDGNSNFPVIFASSYGQEDWKRIYSLNKKTGEDDTKFVSGDYPESYENLSSEEKPVIDHNIKTFRSKQVFNTNKHSIELVDTDNSELLKFTHFSGSFLEFNNFTSIMFSTNNDQKQVIGDQFTTIRKNNANYIGMNQENIILGDRFTKLGNLKEQTEAVKKIFEKMRELHEYKRLFETQRAMYKANSNSSMQLRVGTPFICPVCQGAGLKFTLPCQTCMGTGMSPSTQDGTYVLEPKKWIYVGGDYLWYNDKTKTWSNAGNTLIWDSGMKMWKNPAWILNEDPNDPTKPLKYPEDWVEVFGPPDVWVVPEIMHKYRHAHRDIMDYEATYGNGGDDIINITGSKVETIGTVFNDLESFRVDPVGKIRNSRTYIALDGTYVAMQETPLVEYVDVDDIPGGDYTLTVGNKYTLTVGSRGVKIKTTGPLDISGAITNITGEQINIGSKNEVIIDGGERLELRASVINIKPKKESDQDLGANMIPRTPDEYILLDGNVGIKSNLTVVGGTYFEGEVLLQHITAPDFRYQTELGCAEMPHSHTFHAPPWALLGDLLPNNIQAQMVRTSASSVNTRIPMPNLYAPGFWVPD